MARKIYEAFRIERESSKHGRDFSMKVKTRPFGAFSSRKKAEKAIAMSVRDFKDAGDYTYGLCGFYVEEILLDRTLSDKDAWSRVCEARWSYTKDGEQFSYSPFSTDWKDEGYSGTPADAIRFKPGDWAWMHGYDRFIPVKVLKQPLTPEQWKKKFNFVSDASDDCYLVIAPDMHDHPQTLALFPMNGEPPGRIITLVEDMERKYLNGEAL